MNSTVSELKMAIPYLEHFLDSKLFHSRPLFVLLVQCSLGQCPSRTLNPCAMNELGLIDTCFLTALETLPADLQRNFTLMEELDSKTQDLVTKINGNSDNYVTNINLLSARDKTERFKEIHDFYEKAKVFIPQ